MSSISNLICKRSLYFRSELVDKEVQFNLEISPRRFVWDPLDTVDISLYNDGPFEVTASLKTNNLGDTTLTDFNTWEWVLKLSRSKMAESKDRYLPEGTLQMRDQFCKPFLTSMMALLFQLLLIYYSDLVVVQLIIILQ